MAVLDGQLAITFPELPTFGGSNVFLGAAFAEVAVPEPATFALLGVGSISLVAFVWRKRRRAGGSKA